MNAHIETFAAVVSTMVAALAGSKIGMTVAALASESMPSWMSPFLGPFGALICVLFALRWMAGRLAAYESREENRRQERENDRKATQDILIALVKDTNAAVVASSEIMRDVRKLMIAIRRENESDK